MMDMDSEMDAHLMTMLHENPMDCSRSPSIEDVSIEQIITMTDPDASQLLDSAITGRSRNQIGGQTRRNYETKEQQREVRKQRNRQAAKESRERKKNYQDVLEATCRRLFKANIELQANEQMMHAEINALRREKDELYSTLLKLTGAATPIKELEIERKPDLDVESKPLVLLLDRDVKTEVLDTDH